jgi:hypothetical protein
MVPPVRVTLEPVLEAVPPTQVVPALPETATKPLGKVSVSPVTASSTVPALLKVIVRVDVPPAVIVAKLKALLRVGATAPVVGVITVKVAIAGAALLPLMVTRAPAGIALK